MQKWHISIQGIGPKHPTVKQANAMVSDLLDDGQNVRQATFMGDTPAESANLLHERDEKIAAGKDTKIKPRKKSPADPRVVAQLEARVRELLEGVDAIEKINEKLSDGIIERDREIADLKVQIEKLATAVKP